LDVDGWGIGERKGIQGARKILFNNEYCFV
jgi:hypothetical protein